MKPSPINEPHSPPNSKMIPGIKRYLIFHLMLNHTVVLLKRKRGEAVFVLKGGEGRKGTCRERERESYGPSMSRSNILANLCPIKINQTRAAVTRDVNDRSVAFVRPVLFVQTFVRLRSICLFFLSFDLSVLPVLSILSVLYASVCESAVIYR